MYVCGTELRLGIFLQQCLPAEKNRAAEYVRNRIVFFPLQEGCNHYVIADSRGLGCPVPGQNIILYESECVIICTDEHMTELDEIKLSPIIAAVRN